MDREIVNLNARTTSSNYFSAIVIVYRFRCAIGKDSFSAEIARWDKCCIVKRLR